MTDPFLSVRTVGSDVMIDKNAFEPCSVDANRFTLL